LSRLPTLGPRGEGWVVIQFILLGLVAVLGPVGPRYRGPWFVELAILGGVLGLAGVVLASKGLVDLRDALTPLPHPRDGARLVSYGAYRIVRHPIYGGIILGCAGYALVLGSPTALLGALGMLVFFRLKSAREEVWLRQRYPGYDEYARHVRRLIPFLY
jgi:protein-S-isoprenylcysteine O-methyltransferase Ste14